MKLITQWKKNKCLSAKCLWSFVMGYDLFLHEKVFEKQFGYQDFPAWAVCIVLSSQFI